MHIVIVLSADFTCVADLPDSPAIEPNSSIANLCHRSGAVRDKQYGGAAVADVTDPPHAFVDEISVARGQRLVDDEDVGLDTDRRREGQPRLHAARIGFEWLVDNLAELAEIDDLLCLARHFRPRHSKAQPAHKHIFPTRIFRIETGAEFEDSSDPAVHFHLAGCALQRAGKDLEQRAFAGPVWADHADNFPSADLEGNIAQCPEFGVTRLAEDRLQQHVGRSGIDPVHLRYVTNPDRCLQSRGCLRQLQYRGDAHNTFPKDGFRRRKAR